MIPRFRPVIPLIPPSFIRKITTAARHCPLILSSATYVRVCVCDVYLYSISVRVASARFGICWIIQRESSAVRINDSLKIANSFETVPYVEARKFSRMHFTFSFSLFPSSAAGGKDSICMSHAIWWHDRRYKSTAILRRLRPRLQIPNLW